jgi:putative FmdB family regulatory protein
MPLYDYKCEKCGIVTEYRREFGEDREPICCGISMQRQWSAPSVIFNGPGFYSTDNRK